MEDPARPSPVLKRCRPLPPYRPQKNNININSSSSGSGSRSSSPEPKKTQQLFLQDAKYDTQHNNKTKLASPQDVLAHAPGGQAEQAAEEHEVRQLLLVQPLLLAVVHEGHHAEAGDDHVHRADHRARPVCFGSHVLAVRVRFVDSAKLRAWQATRRHARERDIVNPEKSAQSTRR